MDVARKIRIAIVALIAVLALAGVMLAAYLYFHALQQDELRESLIANCEENGNPLRTGLREEKEAERKIAEHPEDKILRALHLTRSQAVDLAQPQIERLTYDINVRYKAINCQEAYSK